MKDSRKKNIERKICEKSGAESFGMSALGVTHLLKKLEEQEHKPSTLFRAKISLYTRVPRVSLAILSKSQRLKKRRAERPADAFRSRRIIPFPNKTTACVAASVALLLTVCLILYAVGIGTGPGDSLYFVRKIRDRFDLTLRKSTLERLQKQIELAEEKLDRISELAAPSETKPDVDRVRVAVDDYRENVKSLNSELSGKPINAPAEKQKSLSRKLKSVRLKEAEVLDSLISRNPESVLAPGSGAVVALKETSGQNEDSDALKVKFVATKNGEISIPLDALKNQRGMIDFDLTIEADGRKLVIPLPENLKESEAEKTFDERNSFLSDFSIEFIPPVKAMRKDEKSTFTLTLKKNNSPVAHHKVLIEDTSLTSLVNNGARCLVTTDKEGRAEFGLMKTDAGRSSRLRFNICGKLTNGEWVDLGERLLISGIEGPLSVPAGSKILTRTYTNKNGVRLLELENANLKICASNRTPGLIAESIQRKNDGQLLGSLSDPFVSRDIGANLALPVRNLNGPYIVLAEKDMAGYEISYEIPLEQGWIKRWFRILLPEEGELALVYARTEKYDGSWISKEEGVVLNPTNLFGGNGRKIILSGKEYNPREAVGNLPDSHPFSISEPYALIENDRSFGVFTIPFTSVPFIKEWVITANGIGVRPDESTLLNRSAPCFTAAFGFIQKPQPSGVLENFLLEASDPIYFHTVSKAYVADFVVNIARAKIKDTEGEKEALTVRVHKTYQQAAEIP